MLFRNSLTVLATSGFFPALLSKTISIFSPPPRQFLLPGYKSILHPAGTWGNSYVMKEEWGRMVKGTGLDVAGRQKVVNPVNAPDAPDVPVNSPACSLNLTIGSNSARRAGSECETLNG